jgi:hypothetical protein
MLYTIYIDATDFSIRVTQISAKTSPGYVEQRKCEFEC